MIKISNTIKFYAYLGFLIMVLAYVITQLYMKSHLPQLGWTASDWLINYEDGGFKRRGLSGSLVFFIQDHLKMPLSNQIFIIQSLFFLAIFYFLIRLILSKKLNWDILILLCSPLCIMFIPVNIFNSGRKEIVLLALVLFFVFGKPTIFKESVLFIGFISGLFIHELLYFYLPFVMAAYVLKTGQINLKYLGSLFLLSTLIMMILFFLGGEINQGQTLIFLKQRGVELDQWNIFTYDAVKERRDMMAAYKSYIMFALELLFMILLSFLFIRKYLPQQIRIFRIFTLISLLWVSPLYILGADWFRWNHIYSFLFIILIITALPDNQEKKIHIEGRLNILLLIIMILFFVVFFLHIQYDSSGNSEEYLLQYIENKLSLIGYDKS